MIYGKKPIGTIAYMGGVMALPAPFVWSWTQMIQFNADYLVEQNQQIYYTHATASYHSFARNMLVKHMYGEWLLMLDTDHQFEPDIACRMINLMNKHNIDVLVAPYLYKSEPHPPVVYGYNAKTKFRFILGDWQKDLDVLQIHSAGAGCLLVRKSVFQRIQKELKQDPFDILPPYSEDHSFFERLYKLNIPAFFAPHIEFPHLMYRKLTIAQDYHKEGLKIRREGTVDAFK